MEEDRSRTGPGRIDHREELVDEYMEAIGRMMSATMGSHVYAMFDEGDGQALPDLLFRHGVAAFR
jgi:hypothetical protein